MTAEIPTLEKAILKSKGVSEEDLSKLAELGLMDKAAFATVGDSGTLADISGMTMEVADGVMMWATGRTGSQPVLFSIAINLENFTGPLPLGLTRGDNETDIITKLGTPDARGGGTFHPILGTIHPWVRFESKDGYSATLELIDDRLSKISIFDPKVML